MTFRCGIHLKTLGRIIFIPLLLLLFPPVKGWAETIPLKVILNTIDKGEHFLVMTPHGDFLVSREQFRELGFKDLPEKAVITEGGYISLSSLSPEVSYELNLQEAALIITADPLLLENTVINLGYKEPANLLRPKGNSAYLNYAVTYSMGDRFDFQSLSVPAEVDVRIGDYVFYSNATYTKTSTEEKFVRLMTSIVRDDTVNIRRYILGDFAAFSGPLGGSGTMAGMSITKNFAITPYFVRYPGMDISGLLRTPSEVELYMNNVSMRKEKLPPGEFNLSNFYGQTGAGNAVLVIRDAFGREEMIVTPFYLSSNLLKPGLHDYSYNAGFKRMDFGTKSFEYDDPAFLGFHRYGFTETFTGGLRGEVDKDIISFGPSATFVPWRLGEVDASVAVSRNNGRYGYAAFLRYFYTGPVLSGNASFLYHSKDYTNLALKDTTVKPRLEGQIGLGFHTKTLGSLSANFQFLSRYGEEDTKRVNVYYSRTLGSNVSLSVSASRTEQTDTIYEVFAGLIFTLGKNHFGSINYQSQGSDKALSASLEKNPPRGPGLGYKFTIQAQGNDNWEPGGQAYVQYNGPYGIYAANYRRTSGTNSYDVNMSGSVAFIDKSFYLARPVNDSFSLVTVGDLADVRVYYSNEEVAVTNAKGKAVVPGLISYLDNKLSIEASDIPVNYEIAELERYVAPPYRSGSVVAFGITKIQSFEGRLSYIIRGERKAAESALLQIIVQGKVVEVVIGKRGEFYIENLQPGKFPAKMVLDDKECSFEMVVPESKEMTVNLGDISCEIK